MQQELIITTHQLCFYKDKNFKNYWIIKMPHERIRAAAGELIQFLIYYIYTTLNFLS